jgi:hypothetical protein
MAKVTGPLFSMSASGKIGDAMVFFPWKGLNVVRQFVIPVNKMSADQGNQRIVLGGTGRAVGEIKANVGTTSTPTAFAQQLIDLNLIPAGQTKQSFLVKYIVDHYLNSTTNYAAELAALTGHAEYDVFQSGADTLGLVAFDLDYATVDPYNKALGLYLIAKSAIALGFTGTPYTTALASWVTADINGMISDFTGA